MPSHGDNCVKPVIFREYIGVKPDLESLNQFPSDIVDSDIKEFHFILGFARETYEGGRGTGNFNVKWDFESFGKQKVMDIKNQYKNVKVVISIGGRDDGETKYPFSPIEKNNWCNHAFESLKAIIQRYNCSDPSCCIKLIDGIDINYEHINIDDYLDFKRYIKNLITRLKDAKLINVVSIAPSHETHKYYEQLYLSSGNNINWVNYQFYMQTIATKTEFINLFTSLSNQYDPKKLLAGASIDPCDKGNVSQDVFFKSCTDLVKTESLSGIFIWNADDSACSSNSDSNADKPFDLEKIAQEILTKKTMII